MKTELATIYITKDGKKFIDKDGAEKHALSLAPDYIKMPVYYHSKDHGEFVFDYDEMESELEISILKHLHVDCKVEITEKGKGK